MHGGRKSISTTLGHSQPQVTHRGSSKGHAQLMFQPKTEGQTRSWALTHSATTPGLGLALCRDSTARKNQFAVGSMYWYQGELKTHPVLAWHRFFCTPQSSKPHGCGICPQSCWGQDHTEHTRTRGMASPSRCSCSTKDCAMNQTVLLIHPIPTSTCESSVHAGLFTDEKFIFNKYWLKINVNVIQISEAIGPKLVWMWKIS